MTLPYIIACSYVRVIVTGGTRMRNNCAFADSVMLFHVNFSSKVLCDIMYFFPYLYMPLVIQNNSISKHLS